MEIISEVRILRNSETKVFIWTIFVDTKVSMEVWSSDGKREDQNLKCSLNKKELGRGY